MKNVMFARSTKISTDETLLLKEKCEYTVLGVLITLFSPQQNPVVLHSIDSQVINQFLCVLWS